MSRSSKGMNVRRVGGRGSDGKAEVGETKADKSNADTVGDQTLAADRPSAWDIWRDNATETGVVASESDKSRMIERHKLVVSIIDVNSQQLRCESAIAGIDIERACAQRDVDSGNPSAEAKAVLAALEKKMIALSDESQRLATQREFLNASLSEYDAVSAGEAGESGEPQVGRA